MTDEEIAALLSDLEQLLDELGFDSLVRQERVLAAEGISQSPGETLEPVYEGYFVDRDEYAEFFRESRSGTGWAEERGAKYRREDVANIPLSLRTRLAILLDLVEAAAAGTLAMERDIQAQFKSLRAHASEAPDQASSRPYELRGYAPDQWAVSWNGTILFEDPPEAELRGGRLPSWRLDAPDTGRLSAVRSVLDTLTALRSRAGVSRGKWLAPHGGRADLDWRLDGEST